MPELSRTPQANQMADDKLSASSSVFSALARRKRPAKHKKKKKKLFNSIREKGPICWFQWTYQLNWPKGENRSKRYKTRATTCTETMTRIQSVSRNGCKNDTNVEDLGCWNRNGTMNIMSMNIKIIMQRYARFTVSIRFSELAAG